MQLSVVIPSYRRVDLLRLCLASVVRHAPPLTEIIVVDDGSPGGMVSRTAESVPGVTVVRRRKPGGFCRAANAGIAAATAPIVELLNDDAEVTAGWANRALEHFTKPHIAAVAPLVLQHEPERLARNLPPRIDTAGDDYDFGGFARKRGHGMVWGASAEFTRGGPVFAASGCAAFYRRDALLQAGGFPEQFGAYFEDVDLSFRLRRAGSEIVYEPRSVVWHRLSSSYGKRPTRQVLERQSCNEERVFWRNIRGRSRLRWLPRHAVVLGAKALRRWEEGTFLPWFLGRVRAGIGAWRL